MKHRRRDEPVLLARRGVLRAAAAAAFVVGGGAALAPFTFAGSPGDEPAATDTFEEVYRGRHIRITPKRTAAVGEPPVEVLIDGRPLHVMRRADGTYLSIANHYASFASPRDTARAAVDAIGTAQLSLSTAHHH